jgi:hypothetical protein
VKLTHRQSSAYNRELTYKDRSASTLQPSATPQHVTLFPLHPTASTIVSAGKVKAPTDSHVPTTEQPTLCYKDRGAPSTLAVSLAATYTSMSPSCINQLHH